MRSQWNLLRVQFRFEQTIFWRNPAAVFFGAGLPVVLLVIFATINRGHHLDGAGGVSFAQYFVPGMLAFGIASSTFGNLAARFVLRRDTGLLKRARATPLPLFALVGAFVANAVVVAALLVVVVTTVGVLAYDVTLHGHWLALVLNVVVGAGTFCALGLALAPAIPNAEAADPIIFGILLPTMFISGAFQPVADGSVLATIAGVLPVRHLVLSLLEVFGPSSSHGLAGGHLLVVAVWGVGATAVAVRWFRWEPRG